MLKVMNFIYLSANDLYALPLLTVKDLLHVTRCLLKVPNTARVWLHCEEACLQAQLLQYRMH